MLCSLIITTYPTFPSSLLSFPSLYLISSFFSSLFSLSPSLSFLSFLSFLCSFPLTYFSIISIFSLSFPSLSLFYPSFLSFLSSFPPFLFHHIYLFSLLSLSLHHFYIFSPFLIHLFSFLSLFLPFFSIFSLSFPSISLSFPWFLSFPFSFHLSPLLIHNFFLSLWFPSTFSSINLLSHCFGSLLFIFCSLLSFKFPFPFSLLYFFCNNSINLMTLLHAFFKDGWRQISWASVFHLKTVIRAKSLRQYQPRGRDWRGGREGGDRDGSSAGSAGDTVKYHR